MRSADVEAAVDATGGIDPWCSGPDWVLSTNAGFAPDKPSVIVEAADGFALFSRYQTSDGTGVIAGMEPLWGFACPVVGPRPVATLQALLDHLAERDDWGFIVLFGAPEPTHPTTLSLASRLSTVGRVRAKEGITRQIIDLSDGVDAWLDRRSPKFRRNLRRSIRDADEAGGLSIVDVADDPGLFDRIMAIEQQSWKGREGSGITAPDMATMYATMIERLRERGRLHAHVGRLEPGGRSDVPIDVGYILGGLRDRRYRGLQLSYTPDVAARSVGNLLQYHQIRLLCDHDLADHYDMGMDFDYKRRWADFTHTSTSIVVVRAPGGRSSGAS